MLVLLVAPSQNNIPATAKRHLLNCRGKRRPNAPRVSHCFVTDKDALFGSFTHWVLYDLPADKRELPEGTAKQEQLPDGSSQGRNGFDKIGYLGPCPPWGSHRYVFSLYALDTKLSLSPGASMKEVVKAMKGHVLASGELTGRYRH